MKSSTELARAHGQPDACHNLPADIGSGNEEHQREGDGGKAQRHEHQRQGVAQPQVDEQEVQSPEQGDEQGKERIAWFHTPTFHRMTM